MPTEPTHADWRRLYELAAEIKKLAPWGWMQEDDLFAVQNPDTGENGFVSIMGSGGEHFAVGVYLGTEALMGFWMMQQMPAFDMEMFLSFRQLQLSFEDREIVEEEDRAVMKELGLKFRGRNAWPIFRSFQPGYLPWLINPAEARFLIHALEQTLQVAPRVRGNPDLLEMADNDTYFGRVVRLKGGQPVWSDEAIVVSAPERTSIELPMNETLLEAVAAKPQRRGFTLELDTIGLEMIVGDDEGRPYMPTMLLGVDAKSGMVLIHEFLNPAGGPLDMLGSIPATLVEQMAAWDNRPATIHVAEEPLADLVDLLSDALGWKVRLMDELKMLDAAAEALTDWLGAGSPMMPDLQEAAEMLSEPSATESPRHRSSGARPAKAAEQILQLKISLDHISPPIWRRVLVPDSMTLGELHDVIQLAMGWTNSHMHEFQVHGVSYGEPDLEYLDDMFDERDARLSDIALREKLRIKYTYDFGDGWDHSVVVEKFLPVDKTLHYPVCVKGKRSCPPEDCGGPWGYAGLLETIKDPTDPEHDEMIEWIGEDFDPDEFDLDDVNAMLASHFGSRRTS